VSDPPASRRDAPGAFLIRRIRPYGLLLALTTWGVLAVNMAAPGVVALNGHLKGEDFSHFYVLGKIAAAGDPLLLYDAPGQRALLSAVIGGAPETTFVPVYGPQVAVLFQPFAAMDYLPALALWSIFSVAVHVGCGLWMLRRCPALRRHKADVAVMLVASPALWQLVVHGQTSALALAALTAGWTALRAERPFLSGLAFGVLFYKPQLAVVLCVVLLMTGRWRVVAGMGLAASVQLALAGMVFGVGALSGYGAMLLRLPEVAALLEPKPYLLHSFRASFGMVPVIAPYASLLALGGSIAAVGLLARRWQAGGDEDLQFAAILVATVLVSPHTSVYDLVILMPGVLIVADRLLAGNQRVMASARFASLTSAAIGAVMLLPLVPTVSTYAGFQPSVVILTWLLWLTCRLETAPDKRPAWLAVAQRS
jgi:hypothetical protein